jgi:undecaprenyl-diphosphatase
MVHNAFLNPFDSTVYHIINGLAGHHRLFDHIMIFFAKNALEIYAAFFVIAWFVLPRKNIENRHALVMAGFSGILALIINVIISHIWFRPRPFTVFPKGTFTELIAHSVDASFPSDHTAGSFGFAAGSWGKNTKWISYTFTILAIIVMFSRVYAGVHYPTDVIGGMIVGIVSSKVMWKFSRLLYPRTLFVAKIFKFGQSAHITKHTRSSKRSK